MYVVLFIYIHTRKGSEVRYIHALVPLIYGTNPSHVCVCGSMCVCGCVCCGVCVYLNRRGIFG